MNLNENTLIKFYTAFSNADATEMCKCYHPNIQFRDPVFDLLKEKSVCQMWEMLLERSDGNLKIEFSDIKANEYIGSARWTATYIFSKTNRKVVNTIHTQFHFKDGLIIKQMDHFDIWKWSKQAFGITGYLLGWTGFLHRQIQKKALLSLKKHIEKKSQNTMSKL
jgi:ketosteroid isomerase-like protein